jgi:hypothetical protein
LKTKRTLIAVLAAVLIASTYVGAILAPPTGVLRIDPPLPYENESPAEFTIWVQGRTTACDPHVLLVMTDSCYDGLVPPVTVDWPGSSGPTVLDTWINMNTNGDKVPPEASPGYTVASLKDHLETSESIWYAWVPILGESIVPGETYEITVSMESDTPEMLVYILGKSDCGSCVYDMRVPPTIPGFVIPEVPIGTVLSILTMLGTAGLFRFKRE